MSKIEKLIKKLLSNPKNFTWDELVRLLNHFEYFEISKKGKTGGSRRKFVNDTGDIINLHKPHPLPIIKTYIIKQIIEHLKL